MTPVRQFAAHCVVLFAMPFVALAVLLVWCAKQLDPETAAAAFEGDGMFTNDDFDDYDDYGF